MPNGTTGVETFRPSDFQVEKERDKKCRTQKILKNPLLAPFANGTEERVVSSAPYGAWNCVTQFPRLAPGATPNRPIRGLKMQETNMVECRMWVQAERV